jgi:hypothetical protein
MSNPRAREEEKCERAKLHLKAMLVQADHEAEQRELERQAVERLFKRRRDEQLASVCAGYLILLDAIHALQGQMFAEQIDVEYLSKAFDVTHRCLDTLQAEFAELRPDAAK